jgi:diguanylate cyclase (GGDEF)-like protein
MGESVELEHFAGRTFDGLVEIDSGGKIRLWNKSAERITGYRAQELIGKSYQKQPARHVSPSGNDLPDDSLPLIATLKEGVPKEGVGYINHAEGYRLPIIARTLPVLDVKGRLTGALEFFNENKALIAAFQASRRSEETILFDSLTGIGSRPHIENKIRAAIEAQQVGSSPFGILFIDIDHFKEFNDVHGHLTGDKILRLAANTIRHNLRMSDSCGRWGGEEFIGLVNGLDLNGLQIVAEKLRQSIADTRVPQADSDLAVTVSIGATLARPGENLQSLIQRADRLMYKSKQAGRNRVTVGK